MTGNTGQMNDRQNDKNTMDDICEKQGSIKENRNKIFYLYLESENDS